MPKAQGSRRLPRNEGKACDAVVRCIEQRTGNARAKVRLPEKEGLDSAVDLHLWIGSVQYAIEHTQIEAFTGQIGTDKAFTEFIKPVTDELSGRLPGPAVYALHFPSDTHLGLNSADLDHVRRNLIAWIRTKARCLCERNRDRLERKQASPRYLDSIQGKPPGIRYAVRLCLRLASSESKQGALVPSRYAPDGENSKARRTKRLREALRRKCPKLQRCKEDGARTVLVLESDDIALTNHVLVGECLNALLPEHTNLPDEIYLVETEINPWAVHCVKLNTEDWPVERLSEPMMFNEGGLDDLRKASTR